MESYKCMFPWRVRIRLAIDYIFYARLNDVLETE